VLELVLRFVFGGAIVSLFALIGEVFEPKSFAGIFGAAPSVALASLVLAFSRHGQTYVSIEARAMVLGAVALAAYSIASMKVLKSDRVKPWLATLILWAEWLGVALAAWAVTFR